MYVLITLHEVKGTCAAKILLPHAAAPRTNQGLSMHQRINCPIYLCKQLPKQRDPLDVYIPPCVIRASACVFELNSHA